MSRRRASRARSRRRGDALGVALIAGVACSIAAAFAAAVAFAPPVLDAETLCPAGRTPGRVVALLIDATDPLEPRHKRLVAATAARERDALAPGDQMLVYALRPSDGREPALLFARCDPGAGRAVNAWLVDAREAETRWREDFADPLDAAVRRASASAAGPEESPLLDALATVARDPAFTAAARRRLVLASDLLEHRAAFSLYRAAADFDAWSRSPDAAGRLAALDGAEVRLVVFDRPNAAARQGAARDGFWAPYFVAAGARSQE